MAILRQEDLTWLHQVLMDNSSQALFSSAAESPNDSFYLTVDTGCSRSSMGCINNFIPGMLIDLERPLKMEGIAGGLVVRQQGSIKYELLTDAGDIHVLKTTAYYMPKLPCRLFSPQAHFQEPFTSGQDLRKRSGLVIKHNHGVIKKKKWGTTF
jgi:hypothetical protein